MLPSPELINSVLKGLSHTVFDHLLLRLTEALKLLQEAVEDLNWERVVV